MKSSWFLAVMLSLAVAAPIHADVEAYDVQSIESLTDSSEFIVQASVVRQRINKTDQWETRVEKVDRILKSVDGSTAPPFSDVSGITVDGTNRVLLFGCRSRDRKSASLTYCIFLNKWAVPAKKEERTSAYQGIHTVSGQKEPFSNSRCITIDKEGNVLVEPAKVIEAVEKRVKRDARRVSDAGHFVTRGQLLEDPASIYYVLVPFDPEFKKDFLRDLRHNDGWTRYTAARNLSHYKDPEVIAALENCLDDSFVDVAGNDPTRKRRYFVREAAFASLKSMGVNPRRPLLEPPGAAKPK
jgi:hypothetical protein